MEQRIESAKIESKEPISTQKLERAKKFMDILKSVSVSGWLLEKTTVNYRSGVSAYGYFKKNVGDKFILLKVRISDHAGRWSGADLDLRNPKDGNAIIRLLESKNAGLS